LIHTNLGRVPLGAEQLEAVAHVAGSYSNLEYDIERGQRGTRYAHAVELLTTLTGAEAALVVNNNAAGVLLTLASLCSGREVVISRGELVEIGGEFRIPDVMTASGARLREVGTTNRTHLRDYERAVGPETAAILSVHPSNYRVVGFTASVSPRELGELARARAVPFIFDVGSGLLGSSAAEWARREPPVDVAIAHGADVVLFSGDKLLGGPQAGIIAGKEALLARISEHPLLRAVRVDKMTLAALTATLEAHAEGRARSLPLYRLASARSEELEKRARAIASALGDAEAAGAKVEVIATRGVIGGGSLPGAELTSWGLAVAHPEIGASSLAARLRTGDPTIVGRIEDDRVVLDLRTVDPGSDRPVEGALRHALGTAASA
jgi:L-seryl-tRNA(Ser) seleniumtransferase